MRSKLEQRLEILRKEYAQGENLLADLQTQQAKLQETLLRISGAIQVLEEELEGERPGSDAHSDLDAEGARISV